MVKKVEEKKTDVFAVMSGEDVKSVVKRWQYYSIYDFCRSCGMSMGLAGQIAKWCNKAKIGESVGGSGFLIQIVEKECA